MNYIGSISILDRGDAPAQAVIDRNARSLAQRIADETKDELNKVMTRVHAIYSAMDTVDDFYFGHSMEFVNDLAELETILKDEIKKRQYQQQVTVFIVGYSDICHQKFRLLQQVNEFCRILKQHATKIQHLSDQAPYLCTEEWRDNRLDQKCIHYFEDALSLKAKANYINQKGLGGFIMWEFIKDDFWGACNEGLYPMLRILSQECK
uniref:GH18 domain-containing protein n=1 Tax=Biomphalaria glabrata TaxID=6526 RepID=A0A2C9LQK1_BIOGL